MIWTCQNGLMQRLLSPDVYVLSEKGPVRKLFLKSRSTGA